MTMRTFGRAAAAVPAAVSRRASGARTFDMVGLTGFQSGVPGRPAASIIESNPTRKAPPSMRIVWSRVLGLFGRRGQRRQKASVSMPIDWSPFVDFVRGHQRFLIMTHVRPDGDALGSQIGLACALRQLGKSVRVAVASDLGPRYEFANTAATPIGRF